MYLLAEIPLLQVIRRPLGLLDMQALCFESRASALYLCSTLYSIIEHGCMLDIALQDQREDVFFFDTKHQLRRLSACVDDLTGSVFCASATGHLFLHSGLTTGWDDLQSTRIYDSAKAGLLHTSRFSIPP